METLPCHIFVTHNRMHTMKKKKILNKQLQTVNKQVVVKLGEG
jgi:hypothetical protein